MRCEDCRRPRAGDERGWVEVVFRRDDVLNDGVSVLYYCPEHAQQFEADDPNVTPVDPPA